MLASMTAPAPTAAELAILRVLWHGPATVRDVHAAVYGATDTGYTSALKLMQNMLAKGLVTRVTDRRQHVYHAAVSRRKTLNDLVRGWMDAAFSGSSFALAMQALDARRIEPAQIAELKAAIEKLEADAYVK